MNLPSLVQILDRDRRRVRLLVINRLHNILPRARDVVLQPTSAWSIYLSRWYKNNQVQGEPTFNGPDLGQRQKEIKTIGNKQTKQYTAQSQGCGFTVDIRGVHIPC